jgi:ABC-type transport system substrate-binding protein
VQQAGAQGKGGQLLCSSESDQKLALAVQAAGKQIGINWDVQKVAFTDLIDRINKPPKQREHAAFIGFWGSDLPDPAGNLELLFATPSDPTQGNLMDYSNKRVDQLVHAQRIKTDPQERARLLIEAQRIVVDDDQPAPIFYSPRNLMALTAKLGGYQFRPLWYWDTWMADLSGT